MNIPLALKLMHSIFEFFVIIQVSNCINTNIISDVCFQQAVEDLKTCFDFLFY